MGGQEGHEGQEGQEGQGQGEEERWEKERREKERVVRRVAKRVAKRTGRMGRRTRRMGRRGRRIRRTVVARAPTCCLTLFTTSSGALTWPWNRHLRGVSKTNSTTEKIDLHEKRQEGTNQLYSLISRIISMK